MQARHAEGDLWELVEIRCRSHPALLDGLRRLQRAPQVPGAIRAAFSRDRAMFYTGPETLNRPASSATRRGTSTATGSLRTRYWSDSRTRQALLQAVFRS